MRSFPNYLFFLFFSLVRLEEKLGDSLANTDDLYWAKVRCFLCTTADVVRHYPLCPVSIETVFLDNFRK